MSVNPVLNFYLARQFFFSFLFLLLILLGVIYLFDTIELLRRSVKREDVALGTVFTMSLFKLPEAGQQIFPFAILFSGMFTLWNLTRKYELIVIRAAGVSAWQFLIPILFVSFMIGVVQTTVLNPLSASMLTRFENMESQFLGREKNIVTVTENGIWLRQKDNQGGTTIIHGAKVLIPSWEIRDVTTLHLDMNDQWTSRMDAKSVVLEPSQWRLREVIINTPEKESQKLWSTGLDTEITKEEIVESFSSVETKSFWELPNFIRTMESTGFDATGLRIYHQKLMAQPFLLAAIIFLAAAVSLRPPREGHTTALTALGIFIGFCVFFLSSFLTALGASQQIPVQLAAWTPAALCVLVGVSILLTVEDG